jgi:uncharacterized protein
MAHRIVFDRAVSVRTKDADGRLRVASATISMASVDRYFGHEIVDAPQLGLDPQKTYRLYRPAAELRRAVPSACGLPILSSHEAVDAVQFRPDLLVGASLSDARFEPPHLLCSIAIWSQDAIDDIESGRKGALSAGYRYQPIMKPGVTPAGERYDGYMIDIVLNHIALCDEGRIGAAAMIADSRPRRLAEERFRNLKPRFVGAA